MKKFIIYIILLGLTIIFLSGFIVKENKSSIETNDEIVYAINSFNTNLQSISNLNIREKDIICATSIGLVSKNSNKEIVPELAESYEINDDGIEYVFNIRQDLYWSNGNKITIDDIYNFFREIIHLEDKKNIEALYDIYGVQQYKNQETSFEGGVAISKGDNKIKIRLNNKNNDFLSELTKPEYRLREKIQLWSQMDTFYSDINYSGKYKITAMNKNKIHLERNDGNDDKNIDIEINNNTEEAMAAFNVGKIDIIVNPPENELKALNEKGELITYPSSRSEYLYIDEKSSDMILSNRASIYKNISEAISEYESINSTKLECAEGSFSRDDDENINLIQSRKVTVNNISEVHDLDNISICAISNLENKKICEFLSSYLKENKNIKLRYYLLDEEEYKKAQVNNKYNIYLINNDNVFLGKDNFYQSIKYLFNDFEKKLYENSNGDYFNLEEDLFNSFKIMPLMYYNNNIAISKRVLDINIDYYGNIIF